MMQDSPMFPKTAYKPVLFWFSFISMIWCVLLLSFGGITTSLRAGMVFLDWPLSNGSVNPEGWLQDDHMLAEHGHRLLATGMGILSIVMAILSFGQKAGANLKKMSLWLIALVVIQGIAGGLRVKLDTLNLDIDHNLYAESFAVLHATLGQLTFCFLVAYVIASSKSWIERQAGFEAIPARSVQVWGLIAVSSIIVQLVIGAVVRHSHAWSAIMTFPHSHPSGAWIPPAFDFKVAVHFAHRVFAIVVTAAIITYAVKVWKDAASKRALNKSAITMVALLILQIALGAWTVLSVRHPHITTFHMLNGAFLLAVAWMMTYRSYYFKLSKQKPSAKVAASLTEAIRQ
ncbi:MAG: COX15/CtaA family protein [Verrucomicrobiota bacterium]